MKNIELTFIKIPDEYAQQYQVRKIASEMVCDYLKSAKKCRKDTARSKRVEQLLQETRKIIDNNTKMFYID